MLWAPFLPGGARGLLYAIMSLVVLGFFVTVLLPQLTLTSILNDRQTTRYAIALAAYSLIYLGAGTLLARLLRRVVQGISFVSGARDSGTGEPALDRCGRSDPLPVPRPCPRHSSSMWSIRL